MRKNFIFGLYRCLLVAGFPFLVLYVIRRGWRDARYWQSLPERWGYLPAPQWRTAAGGIWLHAVSVGEVLSALPLLRRLRQEWPGRPLYLSCSTLAGHAVAQDRVAGLVTRVFYAPFDYRGTVRRVLRRLRPSLLVVLETEIWPNLYREVKRAGCGLLILNGRISPRTFPAYRRWRSVFAPVLALPDAILAQSQADAERYSALGAVEQRVCDAGNLKYDFQPSVTLPVTRLIEAIHASGAGQVWIAASTCAPEQPGDPDEDELVIGCWQALLAQQPRLLLILAPRKPERFASAAARLERAAVHYVRRSAMGEAAAVPAPGVLLLDTLGELAALFSVADVVFVGGSLVHRGGHNPLEPAYFGKPVLVGPHMENFAEIAAQMREGGALVEVQDSDALRRQVAALLADPKARAQAGDAGQRVALAHRGALERAVSAVQELSSRSLPATPPGPLWRRVLAPLAWLWQAGGALRRGQMLPRQVRLRTPVVSVGGLAMGGVGKTPFVAWLARSLREEGWQPAVLTRGYRRRQPEACTLLAAGTTASVERTGEEAQLLLREGHAHVGIGADRGMVGQQMERQFHPDVFLLDDGFQHARLHRDLDVVLLDAADPWAGGVFPQGRLREQPSALRRAGTVVLTRSEPWIAREAALRQLAVAGFTGPVYTSRLLTGKWTLAKGTHTGAEELPAGPHAAFCGLGQPDSFWRTLAAAGIQPEATFAFADHYRYTAEDLRRVARAVPDCATLLTTEKDVMNLPRDLSAAGLPPVWFLPVQVEVENGDELLEAVRTLLRSPAGSRR